MKTSLRNPVGRRRFLVVGTALCLCFVPAMGSVAGAQQAKNALTISFKGLAGRIKERAFPSVQSDELDFLAAGPDSLPFKIFLARLDEEIAKGNADAKETLQVMTAERLVPKKS